MTWHCGFPRVHYKVATSTVVKIIKEISPVAYQLALPSEWKIHDVFHASLLSPYTETDAHRPNFVRPPLDLVGGEQEYEVEHIINHRCTG
jgi:hypothetical protein